MWSLNSSFLDKFSTLMQLLKYYKANEKRMSSNKKTLRKYHTFFYTQAKKQSDKLRD